MQLKFIAAVIGLFVLTGCGQPQSSQLDALPQASTPIFVFLGGFHSCPSKAGVAAYHLPLGAAKTSGIFEASGIEKLMATYRDRTGITPRLFFSCYSHVLKFTNFSKFHLRYGKGDPTLRQHEQIDLDIRTLTDSSYLTPMFAELQSLIDEVNANSIAVLHIFGHSYGGYTALHTAAHFQSKVLMGGLTTIDPISPLTCSARRLIHDPAATIGGAQQGCEEAPSDQDSLAAIKQLIEHKQLGWWVNVYQDRFRPLHSGPIAELDSKEWPAAVNFRFNPSSRDVPGILLNDFHSYLAVDRKFWAGLISKRYAWFD